MPPPPQFVLVAGPNGAGKSTFTRSRAVDERVPVLDPDAIARQLNPAAPERAAIAAGREITRRRAALVAAHSSFVLETTLVGAAILRHIVDARASGFAVHLIYVCVEPVEVCLQRIAQRAALGGHTVPDGDVRRRYARSLAHLSAVIALVDTAEVFDNSSPGAATLVAELEGTRIRYRAPVLPRWLTRHLGNLVHDSAPMLNQPPDGPVESGT